MYQLSSCVSLSACYVTVCCVCPVPVLPVSAQALLPVCRLIPSCCQTSLAAVSPCFVPCVLLPGCCQTRPCPLCVLQLGGSEQGGEQAMVCCMPLTMTPIRASRPSTAAPWGHAVNHPPPWQRKVGCSAVLARCIHETTLIPAS